MRNLISGEYVISRTLKAFLFFLKLHAKRWMRFVAELGFVRIILVLVLFVMAMRFASMQFMAGNSYLGLVLIPLMQTIQMRRKDQLLLKNSGINGVRLYTSLFLFLSLPLFIVYLWLQEWSFAGILLAFALVIPHTKRAMFNLDNLFIGIGDFLPFRFFEWRTGLRQYGLAVIFLFLLGAGLSFLPGAVPIIIFFLTLNTSVFYLFGESKELLVANAQSSSGLLLGKIKGHLFLFYTMICPLVILDLVFHPELWYVLAYVLIIAFFASANAILFKYAAYEPGERFDNNNVLQGLMLAFFLIPFLMPVPIIMAFINYRKSVKNLSQYFA